MTGLLRPGPHGAVPGSGIKTGRGSCWIFPCKAEAEPSVALAGAVATLLATLAATLAATFSIVTFSEIQRTRNRSGVVVRCVNCSRIF